MSMSKKDYDAIARVIRDARGDMSEHAHKTFMLDMSEYLAATSPRFDRLTFFRACGWDITPPHGLWRWTD